MVGRPPKPVDALKLHGTYQASRHADRENAPAATGVPEKPSGLTGEASALWDSVVPELVRIGAVKAIDAAALRTACEAWALYRAAYERASADPTDFRLRAAVTAYLAAWENAAGKVGLTPVDRLRLRREGERPKGLAGFTRDRGAG